jgi:hypothetical protein
MSPFLCKEDLLPKNPGLKLKAGSIQNALSNNRPSRNKNITIESNFRMDWHTLNIERISLPTKWMGTKRQSMMIIMVV